MTETQPPETQTAETHHRTFYRTDYAKSARLIQSMRHVRCDPHTAKDEASQAKADELATQMALVFAADSAGFNPVRFVEGSRLLEPQASETDDDSEPDDSDELEPGTFDVE